MSFLSLTPGYIRAQASPMQQPRFGSAAKAKATQVGTSPFSQLVAKLPQPLSEAMERAQAKAQSLKDKELNPLHLLYGIFELAQAQLASKPLPFGKGQPGPYQDVVDVLLPPDQLKLIPKKNHSSLVQTVLELIDGYLVDIDPTHFRRQSLRPSEHEATVPPVFSDLLEKVAASTHPLETLLQSLREGSLDSLAGSPIGNSFDLSKSMLALLDQSLHAPELTITPPQPQPATRSVPQPTVPAITLSDMLETLNAQSPILGVTLVQAQNIARNANSPTIELKHLTLALLRHAVEIQEKLPQFVSASPDEIPAEIQLDPYTKYFPRMARTLLDNLLPQELREGLTTPQLQTMLKETETAVDKLVYNKGRRLCERLELNADSKGPQPSQALREVMARTNEACRNDNNLLGYYMYAFTQQMHKVLSRAPGGDHAQLSGILTKLHAQAELKSSLIPNITFNDIGGYEQVKADFEEFIDMNMHPEEFVELGMTPDKFQRGAIMHGPPGTGKTHFAKAVANKMGIPFFEVNGAEFVEKYVGTGPANVRKLFAEARKHPKALIFIDEAEALLGKRGDSSDGGGKERDSAVNAFLSEMDGMKDSSGIIVIAATNRLDKMDAAALRPGRLGKQILVGNPDKDDREAILRIHTKGMPLATDVDIPKIARLTAGCSSVDMRNLATEAALFAKSEFKNGRQPRKIIHTDFDEAFDRLRQGPKRMKPYPEFDTRLLAAHEIRGHGLLAYALDRQLRTLSTIGRRDSAGHVSHMPPEGEDGMADDTLKANLYNLLIKLAGRAAEDVMLGRENITGGARSDYDKARQLLTEMISDGHMTGHNTVKYDEKSKGQLSTKDDALVSFLLNRSEAVAKEMISVINATQGKDIEAECLKRIELRWEEATNFYKRNVTLAQKAEIKAKADAFVKEVLDLLDAKVQESIAEFRKPAAEPGNPVSSPAATTP